MSDIQRQPGLGKSSFGRSMIKNSIRRDLRSMEVAQMRQFQSGAVPGAMLAPPASNLQVASVNPPVVNELVAKTRP